jgi:ubiquinone/menaquinone biosynthesis C-methylase UbiE
MKLNLGCGKDIKSKSEDWVNLNKVNLEGVDVVHDLNSFPYPFGDNSVDFIFISHTLEHLEDIVQIMEELWRVLKDNGKLEIFVPYFKSKNAFNDPTHKIFFTDKSMNYFTKGHEYNFYSNARFKILLCNKYRDAFPFWHLKKYFGIDIGYKICIFPTTLHWILQKVKK